jgi:hypothetical protein
MLKSRSPAVMSLSPLVSLWHYCLALISQSINSFLCALRKVKIVKNPTVDKESLLMHSSCYRAIMLEKSICNVINLFFMNGSQRYVRLSRSWHVLEARLQYVFTPC